MGRAWFFRNAGKFDRSLSGHRLLTYEPVIFFSLSPAWRRVKCGAHGPTPLLTYEVGSLGPLRRQAGDGLQKFIGSAIGGPWNGNQSIGLLHPLLCRSIATLVRCFCICHASLEQCSRVISGLGSGVLVTPLRITFPCCRVVNIMNGWSSLDPKGA